MEDAMIAYTTLFNAADFIYRDLSNKYEYNFIQVQFWKQNISVTVGGKE